MEYLSMWDQAIPACCIPLECSARKSGSKVTMTRSFAVANLSWSVSASPQRPASWAVSTLMPPLAKSLNDRIGIMLIEIETNRFIHEAFPVVSKGGIAVSTARPTLHPAGNHRQSLLGDQSSKPWPHERPPRLSRKTK